MAEKGSSDGLLPHDSSQQPGFQPSKFFWDSRQKGRSPFGTLTFTTLRALDVPLQWWILKSGAGADLLRRLGATTVAAPLTRNTGTLLGLSPYHSLIVGLATGSSLKHVFWKVAIGQEVMQPGFALMIAVFNTVLNSANTVMALWATTSQQPTDQSSLRSFLATAPTSLYVGASLYLVGLFVEWWSEVQRKNFKDDPDNQGKPYSGGLFGLARNINYGGYTFWRAGYSLACGGWSWAAAIGAFFTWDFSSRAVPSMEVYCEKRYGEQWKNVTAKVPHRLFPGIY